MHIDVVVGNPPYNNDIYIPFVEMGHELASTCSVFITPAKWQAKGGEANERFRQTIVPHISKIVYYPDSKEVFDIALSGGISIYTLDKIKHNDKVINNVTINNFNINFPLDIKEEEINIINKVTKDKLIINRQKFMDCKGYFVSIIPTVIEQGIQGTSYIDKSSDIYLTDCTGRKIQFDKSKINNLDDAYKYKLGISIHTFENGSYTSHIWEPNYILGRNELMLFIGSKKECEYADSYFGSKLIYWLSKRFFGNQTANAMSFRFVPDPGAFDHIFTDDELYQKYNLTEEEINIIESVIKEHKV